jgi:hypothetical protein
MSVAHTSRGSSRELIELRWGWAAVPACPIKGPAMNSTLIEGREPAEFDAIVVDTLNHVPPRTPHPAEKQLRIGVQNERGQIYRVIKISGLYYFLDLVGKFRELGFIDTFAEHAGDKEGFDAILSSPQTS